MHICQTPDYPSYSTWPHGVPANQHSTRVHENLWCHTTNSQQPQNTTNNHQKALKIMAMITANAPTYQKLDDLPRTIFVRHSKTIPRTPDSTFMLPAATIVQTPLNLSGHSYANIHGAFFPEVQGFPVVGCPVGNAKDMIPCVIISRLESHDIQFVAVPMFTLQCNLLEFGKLARGVYSMRFFEDLFKSGPTALHDIFLLTGFDNIIIMHTSSMDLLQIHAFLCECNNQSSCLLNVLSYMHEYEAATHPTRADSISKLYSASLIMRRGGPMLCGISIPREFRDRDISIFVANTSTCYLRAELGFAPTPYIFDGLQPIIIPAPPPSGIVPKVDPRILAQDNEISNQLSWEFHRFNCTNTAEYARHVNDLRSTLLVETILNSMRPSDKRVATYYHRLITTLHLKQTNQQYFESIADPDISTPFHAPGLYRINSRRSLKRSREV